MEKKFVLRKNNRGSSIILVIIISLLLFFVGVSVLVAAGISSNTQIRHQQITCCSILAKGIITHLTKEIVDPDPYVPEQSATWRAIPAAIYSQNYSGGSERVLVDGSNINIDVDGSEYWCEAADAVRMKIQIRDADVIVIQEHRDKVPAILNLAGGVSIPEVPEIMQENRVYCKMLITLEVQKLNYSYIMSGEYDFVGKATGLPGNLPGSITTGEWTLMGFAQQQEY